MAQTQLFWIFLDDCYSVEALKKLNLEGFDWSSRHENGQTMLVRCICKAMAQLNQKAGNALETIEWLIRSGASVEQQCTGGGSHLFFLKDKPEQPGISVECCGHNAISYAWTLQQGIRENPAHWNLAASFLTKLLETFAEASSPSAARPRVSIDAGIAELWEKSLAAKDSHDLTIETADGAVTAHAHLLKAASSVVTAMLESPMKEGKTQRIEIKDASSKAVSLFLEILYTCSVQEELDHQTALHALDLAHRWQVDVVVAILIDLLAGMMTDESFASIGEHAVLKGLEKLKAAAQRFGAESKKVQADLKAGRLPFAVAQLFPAASKPSESSQPKPKRRRV